MRAKIEIKQDRIIKKISASPALFENIQDHICEYKKWLTSHNLTAPDTKLFYQDRAVFFDQQLIDGANCQKVAQLTNIFKTMSFRKFGIDSNPHNFIINNESIYFVDFFPFLLKNNHVLAEQFDYPVDIAVKRYFTRSNVICTYLNRLFKMNFNLAQQALKNTQIFLLSHFSELLPREKLRLLKGIQLLHSGQNKKNYRKFYKQTKCVEALEARKETELKGKLTAL